MSPVIGVRGDYGEQVRLCKALSSHHKTSIISGYLRIGHRDFQLECLASTVRNAMAVSELVLVTDCPLELMTLVPAQNSLVVSVSATKGHPAIFRFDQEDSVFELMDKVGLDYLRF